MFLCFVRTVTINSFGLSEICNHLDNLDSLSHPCVALCSVPGSLLLRIPRAYLSHLHDPVCNLPQHPHLTLICLQTIQPLLPGAKLPVRRNFKISKDSSACIFSELRAQVKSGSSALSDGQDSNGSYDLIYLEFLKMLTDEIPIEQIQTK